MLESFRDRTDMGQIDERGQMGPLTEVCINRAHKTYLARASEDTNPQIVKMVLRGKPVDHWYYRSDEWIDQPYFALPILLQAYVGPANRAMRALY